jgi:hypothetical protein
MGLFAGFGRYSALQLWRVSPELEESILKEKK